MKHPAERAVNQIAGLIHPPCYDPHHAQMARRCKRLVINPNFSDGL